MKRYFTQSTTLMGTIKPGSIDLDTQTFRLICRSGDEYKVNIGPNTFFQMMQNLDGLDRDRIPSPEGTFANDVARGMAKYLKEDALIVVQGIYQEHGNQEPLFDGKTISLLGCNTDHFLFEDTHWWLTQIAQLTNKWLDDLFDSTQSYKIDDFAKFYRTNLSILGTETDDNIQESATLSRLIYGLSSAYLLTGADRYYLAAKAGVEYLRQSFRSLSSDGAYCFWAFGRRKQKQGPQTIVPSQNGDDLNAIALYEQIYALAGLAQYYRITNDWEVLEDIRRTVSMFNDFFLDAPRRQEDGFPGKDGYFSHIDYVTLRPDTESLGIDKNWLRKNWNSIGDHIPAYLINLILSLDPLPQGSNHTGFDRLLQTCQQMLVDCSELILEHFPDPNPAIPYVNERFDADWKPDHQWGWQQNRAIVGHNLKIAWNLTRCANYFLTLAEHSERNQIRKSEQEYRTLADRCHQLAHKLAQSMAEVGLDQVRGGVFDCVEREPKTGMPTQFAWGNTKDFWQQEQGILAYLILQGATPDGNETYRRLGRELMAFWNLFFLDHDNQGVYFRVTDIGKPEIQGSYSQKAGHAIAGYHSFELNYLAHIYIRTYVLPEENDNFCLFFRPRPAKGQTSINVLPDFIKPGDVEIAEVRINGIIQRYFDAAGFQVPISPEDYDADVVVEFRPKRRPDRAQKQLNFTAQQLTPTVDMHFTPAT
ncbi:MAG: N-acyl-D-glucosamine 2-epimerase [Candidatus Melainabacteria bacterium]|nr:N-acyl-D-glucosamine 2-epimerase [Candidatus Melainabacteria bacterium]